MAKFQENIRRVGGKLESLKRPHGQRVLLPAEIELCELIGCSKEEYWFFVDQTAAYNGKRKEGYELIPDIRAGETFFIYTAGKITGLTVAGQIAVSVALTAVGYLLSPKPKPFEQGATVRGADAIGSKRFAPQFSFNSLQELAVLGDTVPLVFANQSSYFDGTDNVIGGIRVNGQLLWSQLLSLGRLQQLKAIALFSLSEIDGKPDFEGYAIGDLLLSAYSKKKLDLFFKSSSINAFNRIEQGDKYPDSEVAGMPYTYTDVFSEAWPVGNSLTEDGTPEEKQVWPFSGSRNPTTQAVFGLYSPMPNANVVRLPYELNYPVPKSSDPAKRAVTTKQKKTYTYWPTRAGFTGGDVSAVENIVTYRIMRSNQLYDATEQTGTYPHGIEDVVSMVRSLREEVDSNISVGESFMAGDALVACVGVENLDNEAEEGTPWRPTTYINDKLMYEGIERKYQFEVVEKGTDYDSTGTPFKHPNLYDHAAQPKWTSKITKVEDVEMRLEQDMSDWSLKYGFAYRNAILQRAAIGTVTNSRAVAMTEIGLKSKVFGHIRGANINGVPNKDGLDKIYKDKTNFQLGNIDLYLKRFSFFKLQVRKAGTNGEWQDLTNALQNDHTGLFCIKGNTPEYQYNYIKISHPGRGTSSNSQFEYRFKPFPGNNIALFHIDQKVNLLNSSISKTGQTEAEFVSGTEFGEFVITFAGRDNLVLTKEEVSNTEWKLSYNTSGGASSGAATGPVIELGKTSDGFNLHTVQNIYGPIPPDPTPEYSYDTNTGDITLLSLNQDYFQDGGSTWAWVAYKNGVEVGHVETAPNTASTDVKIINEDNGEVYRTGTVHPTVTQHPEDNSIDVTYYPLETKQYSIPLTLGVGIN